ncbi:MAG: hypothetical protein L6R40_000105 [Gallowayella cf. fulva]|nr:MAG: hypothetical protein L6R40_000105 [Xanthomendoza cf. fulva]
MSPSTNSPNPSLEDNMNQLSLDPASTQGIPLSPPPATKPLNQYASPSTTPKPPLKSLRRTPSNSSIDNSERTLTPVLTKRASYSSLQGASGTATPPRSPALRRVSSNYSLNQPSMAPRSTLATPLEEPERPQATAALVAKEYFARELEVHQEGSGADRSHSTVVILQDDCYGHRYSRPRTSRASLGTIVERPERIHASIQGLATAYVRIGGRHCDGRAAPHPKRKVGLLPSMPFRIHKTNRRVSLTSQAAASVHGAQWMNELRVMCDAAESKLATTGKELARSPPNQPPSDKSGAEKTKLHEGDLYLCAASLEALEGAIGGVCEAIDEVFRDSGPRRAFVCIRPPGHHCSADMPSGFCWVNNVHIGINYATRTHDLTHAAIIDFDLHHGDGSQSIAWAHNARVANMPKNTPQSKRTAIGYFSLHDINSYPCEMGDEEKVRNASLCLENAHGQTIWNVHLQPWKTDKEFWELYQERYTAILSKARSFLRHHTERLRQAPLHPRPKAAIFISAGFDASEWESPGMQRHQVNVPTDFYAHFTRDIVNIADEKGLGVDGRVISVLEGGYSDRALMSGVLSHVSGLTASEAPESRPTTANGLGHEMNQRLGKLEINGHSRHGSSNIHEHPKEPLDPDWWALSRLEEIERLVNPPATAAAPKKVRSAAPTTYSSATQSYTAKVVSPPQNRRTFSGPINSYITSVPSSPRAPSPPPPPVEWATAAHELSKLLVPSHRQTLSCKPEDLNAEATRARRDRQSNIGVPVEAPAYDGKRMQLRDRKVKPPKYASDEDEKKPTSRANRRKTIADVTTLVQDVDDLPPMSTAPDPKEGPKPKGRRSSMASSAGSVNGGTSSPLRPGSSLMVPPTQDPIAVKRSRAANPSRLEAAKQRVPKPIVPLIPPTHRNASRPGHVPLSNVALSQPLAENGDSQNDEFEQLASGMTKMSIKLNVPSKEEQKIREANKRAQQAPKGGPKTMAPKNPPAVRGSIPSGKKPAATTNNERKALVQNLLSPTEASTKSGVSTSLRDSPAGSKSQNLHDPQQRPATSESHLDSAPSSFLPPTEPAIVATAPIGEASGIPPPTTQPSSAAPVVSQRSPKPQAASLPQPPDPSSPPELLPMSPTAPKHTKHDLPVFSSTSAIMFGNPSNPRQDPDQTPRSHTAAQDPLPERPETERSKGQALDRPSDGASSKMDNFDPSVLRLSDQERRLDKQDQDIFDVPESPQHNKARGT